jgi:ubiquinone/menaquinone biosynthesis C-methylase UbiE
MTKASSTYDRIARFYDVDMAQNMRFDDVAFYAHQCARQRGRVLEVGCGSGRILLPLLRDGRDAYGVDASAPMLRELARKASASRLPLRGAQADARELPFPRECFACVLLPYSLVTYLVADDDLAACLRGIRDVLGPGGTVVVDAFVPRPVIAQADYTPDYRRAFGAFTLARAKRITPLAGGTNCIERRYELFSAAGHVVETVETSEVIRPRPPAVLRDAMTAAGFARIDAAWDYGTQPHEEGAQFVTFTGRGP